MAGSSGMHVAIGSTGDMEGIRQLATRGTTEVWPIPKCAKVGDVVVFLAPDPDLSFVATGRVAGPTTPSARWAPKHEAKVDRFKLLPAAVRIEDAMSALPDWKFLTYPRSYCTVPDAFLSRFKQLIHLA